MKTLPVALAMLLVACSSSTEPSPAPQEQTPAGDTPLYVVASRVTLPSGGSTVISALTSIGEGKVDIKRGLELPGFGSAHGTRDLPGKVFVGSAEEPRITRYALSADGTFSKEDSISLASLGATKAPRTFAFVSANKAYAISVETYQV